MLDYPTKKADRFNWKAHGIIQNLQIGEWHWYTWRCRMKEFTVDRYDNWTQGCIKSMDVELYSMVNQSDH